MLVSTLFSSIAYKARVTEEAKEAAIAAEIAAKEEAERQTIIAGPDTFKGNISGEEVPAEVMKVITDYLDLYFRSIYRLELQDDSYLFDKEYYQVLSTNANKLIVESRKLYDFDFRMHKAHYDLKVTDYEEEDGYYYVTVVENDYFNFNFLEDVESSAYNIETNFKIQKLNGQYKIVTMYKDQGFYVMFYEETETVEDIKEIYNYYLDKLTDLINYEKQMKSQYLNNGYVSTKTFNSSYNRAAAVAYADKYFTDRNEEWYCFDDTGGNCQNYASQAINAGGIPMDHTGEYQWKHYSEGPDIELEINEKDEEKGRSQSWVNVGFFAEYAENNEGFGMVAEKVNNIFCAEPGDIIQVAYDNPTVMAHTTIVSKVVDNHALVDSNTLDLKDFPVEGYTYPYRILIKILGYNK